jgi:hypothetical protein
MGRCCLGCGRWLPTIPLGWKPRYKGQEFTVGLHAVQAWIRDNDKWVEGQCTADPAWVEASAEHFCARYESRDRSFGVDAARELVYGSWEGRQARSLEADNKELKRRLAASQKISASRLKRLQAIDKAKER